MGFRPLSQLNLLDFNQEVRIHFHENCTSKKCHRNFRKGEVYSLPWGEAISLIRKRRCSLELSEDTIVNIFNDSSVEAHLFDSFFERAKSLNFLKMNIRLFEKTKLGKSICPKCGYFMQPEIGKINGIRMKYYFCFHCDKKVKPRPVVGSQFQDWVISSVISNAFQGKHMEDILCSLKLIEDDRMQDFGEFLDIQEERIPKEGTLFDIIKKTADKLKKFDFLMLSLRGGFDCQRILVDDMFVRKVWRRKTLAKRIEFLKSFILQIMEKEEQNQSLPPNALDELRKILKNLVMLKSKCDRLETEKTLLQNKYRKRKSSRVVIPKDDKDRLNTTNRKLGRQLREKEKQLKKCLKKDFYDKYVLPKKFYFVIFFMDKQSRFILSNYVSECRDEKSFLKALDDVIGILKKMPKAVIGDKLRAQVKAVKKRYPQNYVIKDFERLSPCEKGEGNSIERRIKDIRKTTPKLRKYSSLQVVNDLITIAVIGQNYLVPKTKVLNGKTPAEILEIPYYFQPYNWRRFLAWVDWVLKNRTAIFQAGLR